MVYKETCSHCKGNRYIEIKSPPPSPAGNGKGHVRCPHCGGTGYKVRVMH